MHPIRLALFRISWTLASFACITVAFSCAHSRPGNDSQKKSRSLVMTDHFGCAHNSQSLCIEYPGFHFSEQDVRQKCSHSHVETFLKEGCPLVQRAHSCDLPRGLKLHVYSTYKGKWREICGIVQIEPTDQPVAALH